MGWVVALLLLAAWPARAANAQADDDPHLAILIRVYQEELNRRPDRAGAEAFLSRLREGHITEEDLRSEIRRSAEYRQRVERQRQLEEALHQQARQERRLERDRRRRAFSVWAACIGVWLGVSIFCWGLGDEFSAWIVPEHEAVRWDVFQKGWIGLACLMVLLFFLSLVLPIAGTVTTCLGLLGLFCVVRAVCRLRAAPRRPAGEAGKTPVQPVSAWRRATVLLALLVLSVVVAAGSATEHVIAYDTLLYHLNVVRWAKTFPAVPGLANLHSRLGTNSGWHLLAALMDQGPLDRRTAWFMPGLACMAFPAYLLHVALLRPQGSRSTRWFALVLIPYGLQEVRGLHASLYFDAPAQFLIAVSLVEFQRWYQRGRDNDEVDARESLFGLLPCVASSVLAFTIKPIAAPLVGVVGGYWLWRSLWFHRPRASVLRFAVASGLPFLLLLGWVLRNIVLSGWPLFPAPVLGLPVDWAMPRKAPGPHHWEMLQSVEGKRDVIRGWARLPGPRYEEAIGASLQAWLPDWWRARKAARELRLLLPAGSIAMLCGLLGLMFRKGSVRRHAATAGIAVLLLLFWFHSAPDLRYGTGLFWIWFAASISTAISAIPPAFARPAWLLVWAITLSVSWTYLRTIPERMSGAVWKLGVARSAVVEAVEVGQAAGQSFQVYVPIASDQCGDSELPCTPYPSSRLEMRRAGSWGGGFRRAR